MYFHCKGRRVLLHSEGAFGVSIDRNYSSRAWHLELKVCVVRYRIEFGECGSSEQCMIATAEWDYVEDQFLASEIIRGSEDHFKCN